MTTELIPEMRPIKEEAKTLGLSYDILRKWCLAGKIVHIRVGNRFFINHGKLCEMLNSAGVEDPS